MTEWKQEQGPTVCFLEETPSTSTDTQRLKVKKWNKIFHANEAEKKGGAGILSSAKMVFILKAVEKRQGKSSYNDKERKKI